MPQPYALRGGTSSEDLLRLSSKFGSRPPIVTTQLAGFLPSSSEGNSHAEPRLTSSPFRTMCTGLCWPVSKNESNIRTASRVKSSNGFRTVGSGGSVLLAAAESSNPTTAISSGTRRAACESARMAPNAIRSDATNSPSMFGARSKSSVAPIWPLSKDQSPEATSSERNSFPRAASVPCQPLPRTTCERTRSDRGP